ncbi:universal stress protein, partial [Deinococcus detaillensis]
MLRQMLVAVDFSVWSRDAAQHACDVARATGGKVTLLHVLEAHESGPSGLEAAQTLLRELSLLGRRPPSCLIVSAKTRLDGPAGGVKPEHGVALAILEVADQLGSELIVIGLHGQGSRTGR